MTAFSICPGCKVQFAFDMGRMKALSESATTTNADLKDSHYCPRCRVDRVGGAEATHPVAAFGDPPGTKPGPGTTRISMPIRQFSEPRKEPTVVSTTPQPKTRDQVWADIEAEAKTFRESTPMTKAQRISAYLEANPDRHQAYNDAPLPVRTFTAPPAPPTLDQVARTFSEAEVKGTTTVENVDALIQAKADELRKTRPTLTNAQAYCEVIAAEPVLYQRHSDLHRLRGLRAQGYLKS